MKEAMSFKKVKELLIYFDLKRLENNFELADEGYTLLAQLSFKFHPQDVKDAIVFLTEKEEESK